MRGEYTSESVWDIRSIYWWADGVTDVKHPSTYPATCEYTSDADQIINDSFQLNLRDRPTSETHDFAHSYLNRLPSSGPTSEQVLFRDIMSDPFVGDHWGPGFDEEVRQGWTDSESDAENEEVLTPSSKVLRESKVSTREREEEDKAYYGEERMRTAQAILRELANGAYWKDGGAEVVRMKEAVDGWREITTQTSAVSLALTVNPSASSANVKVSSSTASTAHQQQTISAQALQREFLFAVSGRPGIIFTFNRNSECSVRLSTCFSADYLPDHSRSPPSQAAFTRSA